MKDKNTYTETNTETNKHQKVINKFIKRHDIKIGKYPVVDGKVKFEIYIDEDVAEAFFENTQNGEPEVLLTSFVHWFIKDFCKVEEY